MDGSTFDRLTRTLTLAGSRRRAVTGLLAGALGLLDFRAEDAAAKKTCLKKAKAHNATHTTPPPAGCTPNCSGKTCGPDGCGKECGSCTGTTTCIGGACACESPKVLCNGNNCVVNTCTDEGLEFNPTSCYCCEPNGTNNCSSCCAGSDRCYEPNGPGGGSLCIGLFPNDACEFDAQCDHGDCSGGVCRCPSGQVPHPNRYSCCVPNNASCTPGSYRCCSQLESAGAPDACGASSNTCVGRPNGAPCDYNEQCAHRLGCSGGVCGPQIGQ